MFRLFKQQKIINKQYVEISCRAKKVLSSNTTLLTQVKFYIVLYYDITKLTYLLTYCIIIYAIRGLCGPMFQFFDITSYCVIVEDFANPHLSSTNSQLNGRHACRPTKLIAILPLRLGMLRIRIEQQTQCKFIGPTCNAPARYRKISKLVLLDFLITTEHFNTT